MNRASESRAPSIADLNAEVAKLTMFRRRPDATAAERKGSVANLAVYRDGLLLAIKASGPTGLHPLRTRACVKGVNPRRRRARVRETAKIRIAFTRRRQRHSVNVSAGRRAAPSGGRVRSGQPRSQTEVKTNGTRLMKRVLLSVMTYHG
jgi:hypothetical protein